MQTLFTIVRSYWFPISLSILIAISILSLTPFEHLPSAPGNDKSHHFIAYGALIFPVALQKPKYWPLIALLFVFYSGAIELIQPYANRYGEWLDLLANCVGLIFGILLAQWVNYLFPVRLTSPAKF